MIIRRSKIIIFILINLLLTTATLQLFVTVVDALKNLYLVSEANLKEEKRRKNPFLDATLK